MDTCHYCNAPITNTYFGVESVMSCGDCVARERENQSTYQWHYYWRSLLFIIPTSVASCILLWGIDEFSMLRSSSNFVHERVLMLVVVAPLLSTGLIVGAAKKGAERRGSLALQLTSVILAYLAFSMKTVPATLIRTSWNQVN
jgi:hypothetical protein